MIPSTLRRLASDHSSLHSSALPPYYLFPNADASVSTQDDLTKLTVLLTGPQGTPYSEGLWRLYLRFPEDYPQSPPKAAFRTRIWHPNVEEQTGTVCVDTLKKDWHSKLTLRDVLITISCLLIQPNPDSALNAAAGHLLQDDYEAFARQARLMTSIHARIPMDMKNAILAAKSRGDPATTSGTDDVDRNSSINTPSYYASTAVSKGSRSSTISQIDSQKIMHDLPGSYAMDHGEDSEVDTDDEISASKENDPSQSPPSFTIPTITKSSSTKRPLADLPIPTEPDYDMEISSGISPSDRNVANNAPVFSGLSFTSIEGSHQSLKLTERNRTMYPTNQESQHETCKVGLAITYVDIRADETDDMPPAKRLCCVKGKENIAEGFEIRNASTPRTRPSFINGLEETMKPPAMAATRKPVMNVVASGKKSTRPRIGLRRL